MVKIIKEGKLPQDQIHRATCGNCGTVFDFKRGEAEYDAGGFGTGPSLKITCPLEGCHKPVKISLPVFPYTPRSPIYKDDWRTKPVDKDSVFD